MTTKKSRCIAAAVVLGSVSVATADVGLLEIPVATLITGTALCVVDGWEYAPRWSVPDNGFVSPTLEACAGDCEADPVCTGATYIAAGAETNCYFKDWGTGPVAPPCLPAADNTLTYQAIMDPAGVACAAITYMNTTVYGCEEEMMIEEQPDDLAPVAVTVAAAVTDPATLAALTPAYSAYTGMDYSPNQVPLPSVFVEDVGTGILAEDAVECATACTAEATCNAASYYGDNAPGLWPGGNELNCYLKALTGCDLPADAVVTGDATIFMIGSGECADAPVSVLAEAAVAPAAVAPAGVALAGVDPIGVAPIADTPIAISPLTTADPRGAAPPLGTVEEDVAATDAATPATTTAAFGEAPVEAAAAGEDATGVPAVSQTGTSGTMASLSGCAAAASALVGAALLL